MCGLEAVFDDRQVHWYTGLDVEHGVGLGSIHVVSDTVDTLGLAEFLVARRPQVESTVSGKEVVLYITRELVGGRGSFRWGDGAYWVCTGDLVGWLTTMH